MGGGGEPLGCYGSLRRKFIVQPRKNTKKSPDSSWIFLYDYAENNWVGGTERFEDAERSVSSGTWNGAFTPRSGTRAGKSNNASGCEAAYRSRIACLLREMTMASELGYINADPKVNEGKTGP